MKTPVKVAPKPAIKPAGKTASKPTDKTSVKPVAKPGKPAAAAPAPKKPAAPAKVEAPKVAPAPAPPPPPPAPTPAPAGAEGDRPKPKGITIVSPKPQRKPKIKKPLVMPNLGAPLLKPGQKRPKPLIASGPNAPAQVTGQGGVTDPAKLKTHLPKRDLEHYRQVLLRKRVELVGDVKGMEGEALQGSSGSLSHTPQHMADQGSDAYDQALSLDLAQVDRNLIKEIDDALERIAGGTYGTCEMTGKPISKERLDELPWTRYSIEGARERERRAMRSI